MKLHLLLTVILILIAGWLVTTPTFGPNLETGATQLTPAFPTPFPSPTPTITPTSTPLSAVDKFTCADISQTSAETCQTLAQLVTREEWSTLSHLRHLHLDYNQLSGGLASLSKNITEFNLSNNNFIPTNFHVKTTYSPMIARF